MSTRILLLGFGNMGRALARGWVAAGRSPGDIAIVDPSPSAQQSAHAAGFRVLDAGELDDCGADVVVLAVKPGDLDAARPALSTVDALLLSIVAGKTIGDLAAVAGDERAIVRAMPNTPAAIRQGITVLCANDFVDATQRDVCDQLMSAVGQAEWITNEDLMDAATAVSGSGPAYVFLMIEALASAAERLGIDAELATRLATATVAGAGQYAEGADAPAAELRRRVTSPGGTTEAALAILLQDDAFSRLLSTAIEAAAARSRELSEKD